MSKIGWTDKTWNPITGCSWISPGCDNCYAKTMANRLKSNPKMKDKYRNGFKVTCHPEELKRDFGKRPKKIFVCSMGDLFHVSVCPEFIENIINKAKFYSEHTFQILTKRPSTMLCFFDTYHKYNVWPRNAWIGVTVEDLKRVERIHLISSLPAGITKFISFEPLLEDVGKIDLSAINWVIVGGETGPKAREMNPDWARSIRNQCQSAGVPFFFKQMSKKQPIPGDLIIKEFPR